MAEVCQEVTQLQFMIIQLNESFLWREKWESCSEQRPHLKRKKKVCSVGVHMTECLRSVHKLQCIALTLFIYLFIFNYYN